LKICVHVPLGHPLATIIKQVDGQRNIGFVLFEDVPIQIQLSMSMDMTIFMGTFRTKKGHRLLCVLKTIPKHVPHILTLY